MLLIIVLSIFLTIIFDRILGKIKRFYNLIIVRNAFFVLNSFRSSKNKLSSLLVILILIMSINIFSLNLFHSLKQNEEMEYYYNNGADIRIQTSFIDYSYSNNISQINGINETMAVLAADGTLIYNSVTVFGINSIIYPRIGRWNMAYSNLQEINEMFQNMNASDDGAIVSDYVANRMNLTINSQIIVTGLPNRSYFERFLVKGIIHSAPGLGLAYGMNIELNQPNQEFMLINDRVMVNRFNVKETNLFFASLDEGYSENDVKDELIEMKDVISINPKIINDQFIGRYISQYIPEVKIFLIIQIVLVNFIGLIIIITNIDFVIRLRDQNNAILHSIGNSNKNLVRMIFSELIVIEITSFITAIILSVPLAFLSLKVNRASFTIHNIIPYEYSIFYVGILLFMLIIIIFTLLAVVPSLVRFSKRDLVTLLRQ